MPPEPFIHPLPLTEHGSRVESQLDTGTKNYFALLFKPGFPLQAQELLEMQEIFYVQQTLNSEMRTTGWTGPVPWTGATPLNKDLIGFTYAAGTNSGPITIKKGWYCISGLTLTGGIDVWAYNNTDRDVTPVQPESNTNTGTNFGLRVLVEKIECTTSTTPSSTEDASLADAGGNVINGPCGAARLNLKITGVGSSAQTGESFAPIFTNPIKTAGASPTRTVTFKNGDTKQVGQ